MGKIGGNSTNFRPHLNCCDPDAIHDYSPPAFRWSINVSDIDLVKRANGGAERPALWHSFGSCHGVEDAPADSVGWVCDSRPTPILGGAGGHPCRSRSGQCSAWRWDAT